MTVLERKTTAQSVVDVQRKVADFAATHPQFGVLRKGMESQLNVTLEKVDAEGETHQKRLADLHDSLKKERTLLRNRMQERTHLEKHNQAKRRETANIRRQ
jgi:hypothetical protein